MTKAKKVSVEQIAAQSDMLDGELAMCKDFQAFYNKHGAAAAEAYIAGLIQFLGVLNDSKTTRH